MNTTASEVETLLNALKPLVEDVKDVDVAVCPPFPYLVSAFSILQGSGIQLGAQNMAWEESGAFTGEVSGRMLKDAGCDLVILGHSERRHIFHETDDMIRRKIKKALAFEIDPIVCVGETLDEREAEETKAVVQRQVEGCLGALTKEEMDKISIAYEPVWAIGTGKTATPDQAQEVHGFIRGWLKHQFSGEISGQVRIQYGGSVKPENAGELLSQPDIDGALVGGASLKAESFAAIVKAGTV